MCQLELSLSLLLRASYSRTLLPGYRERKGGRVIARERDRGLFLHLTQRRSTASTPLDAIGESQKKEGRQPRLSVTLEEPAVQLTDNTSVPHGLVWYSPLGLADRLTGFHGGQANTKQIQTGGTELQ